MIRRTEMRSRFDKELAQLNSELINMGTLIEEAIQNAVGALVNQNVVVRLHNPHQTTL